MDFRDKILKKITVRNSMALSFSAVFLYAVIITVNQETGLKIVGDNLEHFTNTETLLIGTIGGGIGGVFFKMVSDMVTFYFRRAGTESNDTINP